MKIGVLGLGYVGAVTAACLAELGHDVWGYDINSYKRLLFADGFATIEEPGIATLLRTAKKAGRLHVADSEEDLVRKTAMAMVCVPTLSKVDNDDIDLTAIHRVTDRLARGLVGRADYYTIVYRSTLFPGTAQTLVNRLEYRIGRPHYSTWELVVHPEFTREGSAIDDFFDPPLCIIGGGTSGLTAGVGHVLMAYGEPTKIQGEVVPYATAELIKYSCNAFHALKVAFANEIAQIADALDVDGVEVMELLVKDKKLNVSEAYLRPGLPFGGACLPKDVRALTYRAKHMLLHIPVIDSILFSNAEQQNRLLALVLRTEAKRIGMIGLPFKEHTTDMRESPMVKLLTALLHVGRDVSYYEPTLTAFDKSQLPQAVQAAWACDSLTELISRSDLIVVSRWPKDIDKTAVAGMRVMDFGTRRWW